MFCKLEEDQFFFYSRIILEGNTNPTKWNRILLSFDVVIVYDQPAQFSRFNAKRDKMELKLPYCLDQNRTSVRLELHVRSKLRKLKFERDKNERPEQMLATNFTLNYYCLYPLYSVFVISIL